MGACTVSDRDYIRHTCFAYNHTALMTGNRVRLYNFAC